MKAIYSLLFALLLGSAPALQAQELWDDFDDRRQVDYGFIHGVFIEYQPNPNTSGSNTSPMAVRYLRNPVEVFDVIVANVGQLADISDYISGAKNLTLDVIAPAPGITVQITLEDSVAAGPVNYPVGRRAEFTAVSTTSGAWETLTFNLVNEPDPSVSNTAVNRAVLLVNPGTPAIQTWYFDNWFGPERASVSCIPASDDPLVFMDAECEQDLTFEFYHGQLRRTLNSVSSAANPSSHVLRYDRNVGEMDDIIIAYFPEPLEPGGTTSLLMEVYDTNAPSVYVMALQTAGGADVVVISDSTLASEGNQWVQLRYDLSGIAGSNTVERFVMLYKPGQFSVGRTYLDNIRLEILGIGLNDLVPLPRPSVFPNPASDVVRVQVPETFSEGVLQIFDVNGREMAPARVIQAGQQNLQEWQVSSWPLGAYWLRWSLEGRSVSQPFMLTR